MELHSGIPVLTTVLAERVVYIGTVVTDAYWSESTEPGTPQPRGSTRWHKCGASTANQERHGEVHKPASNLWGNICMPTLKPTIAQISGFLLQNLQI